MGSLDAEVSQGAGAVVEPHGFSMTGVTTLNIESCVICVSASPLISVMSTIK